MGAFEALGGGSIPSVGANFLVDIFKGVWYITTQ